MEKLSELKEVKSEKDLLLELQQLEYNKIVAFQSELKALCDKHNAEIVPVIKITGTNITANLELHLKK